MHICPCCHSLIFNEPHRCPPRWIALVDTDSPEGSRIDPGNFTVFDDLYADSEEGAATDAAQRFAHERGGDEEGTVFVGVMRYDEYLEWKRGHLSAFAPGPFTIPLHEFYKFEVECVFSVRYHAHEANHG